jgi:transcriptional regulator with XRE-family HTH domain
MPTRKQQLQKKPTTKRKEDRVKVSESARNPENEPRLAVGALLGFYRRIRHKSQEQLAEEARIKPSALAMFESGQRLPLPESLDKIATALGLDAFQQRQLEFMSTYSGQKLAIGEQWFMPEDVLTGIPVFLRRLEREAEFQRIGSISETWIVTSRPLAIDGEMYQVLKRRLENEQTKFIYFLDTTAGESPFRALWSRLIAENPKLKDVVPERLRCVLTPTSFCLYHYAICNPGQVARMFGRLVVYAGGIPVGILSMDSQHVSRAYDLLFPIYELSKSKPDEVVKTECGEFRLLQPAF